MSPHKEWGQTQRGLLEHWKRVGTAGKQMNHAKTWKNRGKIDVEVGEDQLIGRMGGKRQNKRMER